MDKENICRNSFFFDDDSSFDDMPELTDSSDTSEQVEEEPYLVLSDNTGLQFRAWYPAPHVCFWNAYLHYAIWLEWLLGFQLGPAVEELAGTHRQHAFELSALPPTVSTVAVLESESESEAEDV